MTVCLISFEYKRTAVKLGSVYYLSTFLPLDATSSVWEASYPNYVMNVKLEKKPNPILYSLNDSKLTDLV